MRRPEYRRITGEWERGGSQEAIDIFEKFLKYGKFIAIVLWIAVSILFFYHLDLLAGSMMFLAVTLVGLFTVIIGRKVFTGAIDSFREDQEDQVKMFDTTYGTAVGVSLDAIEALGWEYSIDSTGDLTVPGRGPLIETPPVRSSLVEESKEVTLEVEKRAIRVVVSEMKDLPYTHLEYIHVRIGPVNDGNASEVQSFRDHLDKNLPPFLLDPDDYEDR